MPTIDDVMTAGFAWLYDTVQPDEAIDQHHGHSHRAEGFRLIFIPRGGDARGRQSPVIAAEPAPLYVNGDVQLLTEADIARLREAIGRAGGTIVDEWNGAGCCAASFQLADLAHPTLVAAVSRYRAGCPGCDGDGCRGRQHQGDRGDVFCSAWWRRHNVHLVRPTWPTDDREATRA